MTHTYAVLEISAAAWHEIATKLRNAGYSHAFGDDGTIDMHGIGVQAIPEREEAQTDADRDAVLLTPKP
jgi:hypothetical protein